jgi:hypothetical protein
MKNSKAPEEIQKLGETNLRFILGLKLNQYRKRNHLSLKELSEKSGLSVSYLNEIEKGKKYPKADKALALAESLGVSYDELVSLNLDGKLKRLNSILRSGFLQNFPMDAFGISISSLMEMMAGNPEKFSSLVDTFITLGKRYDLTLHNLHFAALRSFAEINYNYSEEIEAKVDDFCRKYDWPVLPVPEITDMQKFLTRHWRYIIDEDALSRNEDLRLIKNVFVHGRRPKLMINKALNERHIVYLMAREIGYRYLGLKERIRTSPAMDVESIAQLMNHYYASYFARALLLNKNHLVDDLMSFFRMDQLNGARLLDIMQKYKVNPGLFLYRLSQLLPRFFGMKDMFYLRFSHTPGTDSFKLIRELHFGNQQDYQITGLNEHSCRRWMALRLLKRFSGVGTGEHILGIQRMLFVENRHEYLTISVAQNIFDRSNDHDTGVTIGIRITEKTRQVIRFLDDPSIPRVVVGSTCERCRITDCGDRASSPSIYFQEQKTRRQRMAVQPLLEGN